MIFAQLLYVFTIEVQGKTQKLAFILPYDQMLDSTRETQQRDKDLRFTRIRARPRSKSTFIYIESILRGVLLIQDHSAEFPDEFIVAELVSDDIWMRMKHDLSGMRLEYNVDI